MYNFFAQRKKQTRQQKTKQKQVQDLQYVKNYCEKTRPVLLNNYHKRINQFIRKMEFQTANNSNSNRQYGNATVNKATNTNRISSKVANSTQVQKDSKDKGTQKDERLKQNRQSKKQESVQIHQGSKINAQQNGKSNQRRYSHRISVDRGASYSRQQLSQNMLVYTNTFKYKTPEDWISIYNQMQRKQRYKNLQYFKKHYDDPNMAFRSISSQSKYNPKFQFRDRDKKLEINPPMKHTAKPTQSLFDKFMGSNQKVKPKDRRFSNPKTQNSDLKRAHKTLDFNNNRNHTHTNSNVSSNLGNDDMLSLKQSVIMTTDLHQTQNNEIETQQEKQRHRKSMKAKPEIGRSYFKQMVSIQSNIKDVRSKKLLKSLLYKCGVYRRKNKNKAVTEMETDQFTQFETINLI